VLNIGYVMTTDYPDPLIDPHAEFQRFKTHPFARPLKGGKMIRYGAGQLPPAACAMRACTPMVVDCGRRRGLFLTWRD
jgi:flavin-dependent dehydrogenase